MKHAIFAVASAVLALHTILGHGSIAKADSITTSITQDGGTFTNSSGTLLIGSTDQSLPAVLTLKNGAVTSGITEIQVGAFPDNMFGNLELLSGSSLTNSGDGYIGIKRFVFTGPIPSGLVTVSGIGSKWSNTGALIIGGNGSGSLNIADGGQVSNNSSLVGGFSYAPSTSSVSVSGAGSKWTTTNDLSIGGVNKDQLSQSNVSVTDSGLIEVGGLLSLGYNSTLTLDGGTVSTHSFDNSQGTFQFHDGLLSINGGGIYQPGLTIDGSKTSDMPTLRYTAGAISPFGNELTIGKSASGKIEVTEGSQISGTNLSLGIDESGNGELEITGSNSEATVSVTNIGSAGIGKLNVREHGYLLSFTVDIASQNGSIGIATISGTGSTLSTLVTYEGNGGAGTLLINDGASAGGGGAIIGNLKDSIGTVTIDGEDSKWLNTYIAVGSRGSGTININNGGYLRTGSATDHSETEIGSYKGSNGSVNVNGKGSTWNSDWELYVGFSGSGNVHISNGGIGITRSAILGYGDNSEGEVTIEGIGSKWTVSSSLQIGYVGEGRLRIMDGGYVLSESASILGQNSSVVISGPESKWVNRNGLQLGFRADILTIEDGGTLMVGSPDGLLNFLYGTITGDGGTIIGNINSYGLVSPGSSPGIMTIDGNYTQQTAGELHIELAGLDQGTTYDFLHVTGITTLGGLLTLDILDGFENLITPTDTFTILTSGGGLTGEFTNLDLHHRLNARWGSFLVSYEHNSVVLSDFVAVPEVGSIVLAGITALACVAYWFIQQRQPRMAIETEAVVE